MRYMIREVAGMYVVVIKIPTYTGAIQMVVTACENKEEAESKVYEFETCAKESTCDEEINGKFK